MIDLNKDNIDDYKLYDNLYHVAYCCYLLNETINSLIKNKLYDTIADEISIDSLAEVTTSINKLRDKAKQLEHKVYNKMEKK